MNITKKKNYPFLIIALALFVLLATQTVQNVNAEGTEKEKTSTAVIDFEAGALSLESVPSFTFKKDNIFAVEHAYELDNGALTSLEIRDLTGSIAGWQVTVSLSEFKDQSGNLTLKGATLDLNLKTVDPLNGTVGASTELDPIEVTAGGQSTELLTVEDGRGVWGVDFVKDGTTLTVFPGTATADESSATLTWNVATAP